MRWIFVRTAVLGFVALFGLVALASGRLPTSPPMRAVMVAVRDLVADNRSLVTHRRMPRDRAVRFGRDIDARLAGIVTEAAGNSQLAKIVEGLKRGAAAIAGQSPEGLSAIEGIVLMDEMLARYAETFDHPGWKGPRDL